MNSIILATAAALAFALTAASAHASTKLKTLVLGQDIQAREGRAWEYDKASAQSSHSDFQFKIDDHAEVIGGQIQLAATLANTSGSKKTVYLVSEKDALKFETENIPHKKQNPNKTPQMYVVEIPAQSEVKFIGRQNLDELDYSGSPETTLKWVFQYWTNPRPKGEVKFRLPTLQEAHVNPLKLTIQKFSGAADSPTAAKFVATLQNISQDPQKFCTQPTTFELTTQDGKALPSESATLEPRQDDCFTLTKDQTKELDSANVKKTKDVFRLETAKANYSNLKKGEYMLKATIGAVETTSPVSIP